jgi:hypothetical protein
MICCLCIPCAMAAETGTKAMLPKWGVVVIPEDIHIEEGAQSTLLASGQKYDVSRLFENIYPLPPKSYQIIKADGASFQYGIMLRYSLSLREARDVLGNAAGDASYGFNIKSKTNIETLASQTNDLLRNSPPQGYRLIQPIDKVKYKSNVFYEGTVAKYMEVNQHSFEELVRVIGWQHGNFIELAIVMTSSEDEDGLMNDISKMVEMAKI